MCPHSPLGTGTGTSGIFPTSQRAEKTEFSGKGKGSKGDFTTHGLVLGSAGLGVEHDSLRGLFQSEWFCDSLAHRKEPWLLTGAAKCSLKYLILWEKVHNRLS